MPFKIIGNIVKPFGLKGNLLIKGEYIAFNEFSSLKNLFIGKGNEPEEVFEIESINIYNTLYNVKLNNIDSIQKVDLYKNYNVFIPENKLSVLLNETIDEHDYLIDYKVFDNNGDDLGNVKFCEEYPTYKILTVERDNNKEFMVPLIDKFIKSIDRSEKKIIINLIPGLIDEN